MANIVVAGGSGFIGSHLCKKLINEGHHVLCIDNLITGDKKNVENILENPNFTFIQADITQSLEELKERANEMHYIFDLASPASPNKNSLRSYIQLPIETLLANSIGTYNLLTIAKEKNASFLYTSTSEIYGNPSVSPQPESYFGNVNPNGIRSVYDEAKRFGEAMTFGFKRKYTVDVRIIRVFNTYGPYMQKDDGRVVSNFINQAITNSPITLYGDGTQTRSFCYVDDMVDAIGKAMFSKAASGEVINLGNPDERKISEVATYIKEITGSQSTITNEPLPEDDPLQRKPDITKARNLLGWEPKVTLEEGLHKTVDYFRNAS